ncbi:MAG: methyl-accepting chemotaxis protein [Candidatus Kariarchaeaceae archaeon]
MNGTIDNMRSQLNDLYKAINSSGTVTFNELSEEDKAQYNEAIINFQVLNHNINNTFSHLYDTIGGHRRFIEITYANANVVLEEISLSFQELIEWTIQKQKNLNKDFSDNVSFLISFAIFIILIGIIFVIITMFFVNYQIANPIKGLSKWSEYITEGDLSKTRKTTNRKDEVGVLLANFKEMNRNLRHVIGDVKETSGIVSSTAEDLSSNTEEINATAEEVSAIAQSMAKGSLHQAELITTIVEELQVTSDVVDNVISQINYNLITIRELSEQTNVLSLNTAIEAANAGEFGKGFTVIADNIRKMSQQSKQTTEEVTKDSRDILMQLRSTFTNITEKIETVASVSEETAASAEEVAASAEEMTATMQNVSATSQILNDQSSQSLKIVEKFIID